MFTQQSHRLVDRSFCGDDTYKWRNLNVILLQIIFQPFLTTTDIHDGIINVQVKMVVFPCLSPKHPERNTLLWDFIKKKVTERNVELSREFLKVAHGRLLLAREPIAK